MVSSARVCITAMQGGRHSARPSGRGTEQRRFGGEIDAVRHARAKQVGRSGRSSGRNSGQIRNGAVGGI